MAQPQHDESWMPEQPWGCPDGVLVLPYTAPRESWLAARRAHAGASELAAIFDIAHWAGADPYSVWAEKTGRSPGKEQTRAMARGLIMEKSVVDLWVAEDVDFPIQVKRRGLMRSKTQPLLAASLDFLSVCPAGRCCVEVKTQGDTREWDNDEVPLEYQLQGQAQLFVTGRDHVHFIAMGHRFEIEHRIMGRDEALIEMIVARVVDWWTRYVETDQAPPATAKSLDTLKKIFGNPDPNAAVVELPEEYWKYPERDAELAEMAASIAVERDTMKAQLCAVLGDAQTGAIDGDPIVTWNKTRKVVGVDQKFVKANPELCEPYKEQVPSVNGSRLVAEHPDLIENGVLRYQRTFKYVV